MSVRIAQIADLHFGRERPALAEALVHDLESRSPTLVVVCGDLTQSARESEFRAARAFLDALPAPVLAVPGNHDLPGWRFWSRFARPWRRWRRHLITAPDAAPSAALPGLVTVGVNTARRLHPSSDWSRGRISPRQVAAVRRVLRQASPGDLRVLVAHHPFLLTPAGHDRGLVGGREAALRQLRGHADLVLGGHVHLAYAGVAHGLVVAQAGTAVSDRLKGEANAYNLIEATAGDLTVTGMHWSGSGFEPGQTERYVRVGRAWRLDA